MPDPPPGTDKWVTRGFSLDPEEEVQILKEVEVICRDTMSRYAEEDWEAFPRTFEEQFHPARTTMGKEARGILDSLDQIDIRRLAVGQPAPELTSIDCEGKPLKLSEFRGKVVLLNFSGQHCVPCRAMIPHEREMVKKLEGRPFVLLGIDAGTGVDAKEEARLLKDFLAREKITWRVCSVNQTDITNRSASLESWNVQHIPVFYLIDDLGVIRQRFDGYVEGQVLDSAVERLIKQAEERIVAHKSK
jgi:thiol-disulfide isomerase/thioredoxin